MAWSPISMGMSQGKDEGTMQLFARASFKNKYRSFSWNEDETGPLKDIVSYADIIRIINMFHLLKIDPCYMIHFNFVVNICSNSILLHQSEALVSCH